MKVQSQNLLPRGFTLLELLITISIIAALVAIGVPATQRLVHKGRATHCLSNLRNLGAALQLYLRQHHAERDEAALGRAVLDLPEWI